MIDFSKATSRQAGTTRTESLSVDGYCREDNCERLDLHEPGPKRCMKRRGREFLFRTRSQKFRGEPWRAHSFDALHESVYNATSTIQPRTFSVILGVVENDYGSCCERSVHRHLLMLRSTGKVVRLDFAGRLHAYLREGSKLIHDPELVLEQIIDLHAERTGAVERAA